MSVAALHPRRRRPTQRRHPHPKEVDLPIGGEPDFREPPALDHGRLGSRAIWTADRLNGYLTFPHVGQAFLVERTATGKKSGKTSVEHAFGVTSHPPDTADLLKLNRGHWKVESVHNILDSAFDEDRLRIRTGPGPVNTARLRRFAIGLIRGQTRLRRRPSAPPRPPSRRVLDYLRMTEKLAQAQRTRPARR